MCYASLSKKMSHSSPYRDYTVILKSEFCKIRTLLKDITQNVSNL